MKDRWADLRAQVLTRLLAERTSTGHWEGQLSSSPLATAVAVVALHEVDPVKYGGDIDAGRRWLEHHQNPDGGWGDCDRAPSNLSTTLLCWSAFPRPRSPGEEWVRRHVGVLQPEAIAQAVLHHYGADRSFSVPILTQAALTGRLGPEPWRLVPQLPFELAACPPQVFRWLRLPVVSYAFPALIALGLVRHARLPSGPGRRLRDVARRRVLRLLTWMQPPNGGFLEATPLTGFVVLSLTAAGYGHHPVVVRGVRFLLGSRRQDGSWPIDTNLATWLTTLAVNAGAVDSRPEDERAAIRDWLLNQQFRTKHPYTHAAPGGWAWTDLPGGVPDADDTAGALRALHRLGSVDDAVRTAGESGVRWLLGLQNRDGGIPTFCAGWGRLPFDRSCPDLTAHALQAFADWLPSLPPRLRRQVTSASRRALAWLAHIQAGDGSWTPLWFGNPWSPDRANPTYGTVQVVRALRRFAQAAPQLRRGLDWLLAAQNPDGGWGGAPGVPSSVEETALALSALVPADSSSLDRGFHWLSDHLDTSPTPLGLYFASLWYSEKLYPLLFTLQALTARNRES